MAVEPSPGKEVWLFTMRFPFGKGEAFIESEIPVLLQYFDRVRCIPMIADAPQRPVPDRVDVIVPVKDMFRSATPMECIRDAAVLVRLFRSELKHLIRHPSLWYRRSVLARQLIHRLQTIRNGLFKDFDPRRVILYSYWTTEWATLLAMLRTERRDLYFVSRVHGFDLFEDSAGGLPFREFQLEQAGKVFTVSNAGLNYISKRHPQFRSKFEMAHLGTADHGMGPIPLDPVPTIVSCSSLIPLKCVGSIAQSLSLCTRPIRWVHFGDGLLMDELAGMIRDLPAHIEVELKGAIANTDLMQWYKEHPVDVLVHMSRKEGGVPVALQEAASFGIPLLGADAGGVKEIVNDLTGTLLPADPHPQAIMQALEQLLQRSRSSIFRERIREYWSGNFNAAINHARFAQRLIELHEKSSA
jgi:colanic acid/amylovoran biosynthesis glycosyltransferase